MFGIRNSRRGLLRPAGVAAVVIGVVGIVGALMLAPASMAAGPRSATAALAELTIGDASAVGVSSFAGRYGTADTPDLTLPSDADSGDFSDPDGVLDYITVNGTQLADTSWDAGSTQLTARANATGFELNYNGVDDFATAGSIDSYARCLDRGGALAYARGDGTAAYVLGQRVPEGVPTTIQVTGAQLNMPDVDSGTLTVTVTRVESAVNTATEVSAEAYLDVRIEGDLKDASGARLFQGMLVDMKVGHVKVTCTPAVGPQTTSASPSGSSSSASPSSESPTSEGPSETPSSESPSSETPTSKSPSESPSSETPSSEIPTSTDPTTLTPSTSPSSESPSHSSSPSPSETPTTGSESPTGQSSSGSPSGSATASSTGGPPPPTDDGGDGDGGFGPFLPTTGGSGGTILAGLVVGLSVALVGVVLLNLAARRSRG